jgi:hypothetical protein
MQVYFYEGKVAVIFFNHKRGHKYKRIFVRKLLRIGFFPNKLGDE